MKPDVTARAKTVAAWPDGKAGSSGFVSVMIELHQPQMASEY